MGLVRHIYGLTSRLELHEPQELAKFFSGVIVTNIGLYICEMVSDKMGDFRP
jgi:hypothetical protein